MKLGPKEIYGVAKAFVKFVIKLKKEKDDDGKLDFTEVMDAAAQFLDDLGDVFGVSFDKVL